jgi:signal transduction histidine kinase
MNTIRVQQQELDTYSPKSQSEKAWQDLALDSLSRLTREFATRPDSDRLVNLVLLSMTGQLSARGAFACFVLSESIMGWSAFKGSGVLHNHSELELLLRDEQFCSFCRGHPEPFRVCDLAKEGSVSDESKKYCSEAGVAVAVPLFLGENLLGILGLAPKIDESQYTADDLNLMMILANTVSPLLNTSILYAKLESLNQWQRDVIDSVRQGVLIFTDSLELKQANAQAQKLFEILGRSIGQLNEPLSVQNLLTEDLFPGWLTFVQSTSGSLAPQAVENLVVRAEDDDRVFLVHVSRTSDMSSEYSDIIITFDDITEQRHNEQRMFEMEKFAEKGVMAASIAHELNNHLALILGGLELAEIASGRKDLHKTQQSLEKLKKHALTMERFTAGLTDYSRLDSEKTEVDLNSVVKDVVSFAKVQKRFSGVTLKAVLASQLPALNVDVDQMAQLLMNLLNNAADAIRDAGNVQGEVRVSTGLENFAVFIQVSDNGNGIPDNLKDKLFRTRFTTKDYGHGFGMVTCGRILEHHDASHSIESESGKGTSITISFPRVDQSATSEVPPRQDKIPR